MTNVFDVVKANVTAKEAAERYGLKFGRNGRAVCPWHRDTHPDLTFYKNGSCYCFACHNGGDAASLTQQLFNLSPMDAVKKLNIDFKLHLDLDAPFKPTGPSRVEIERERKKRENKRWIKLCDEVHEADKVLNKYNPENGWDSPEFVEVLKKRTMANVELDMMWEGIELI